MSRSKAFTAQLESKRERLRLLQQKERFDCERSFFHFVQAAWRVLNPTTPFQSAAYLELIAEHLEQAVRGETRRLIVNQPPRSGKSSLVSVFLPLWWWLHDPSSRWLFASHAVDLALKHSRDRATILESPWWKRHWGSNFRLTAVNASEIKNDRRGYTLATTVQGSTGKGGNFLVLDDPHSAADSQSDALRKKDNEQIRGSLMSRLDDPKRSTMIVLMQRLHMDDATGMLLELGEWTHLCLPSEELEDRTLVFPISGRRWERKKGALLDPNRFPPEVLTKLKRDMGSSNYSGQYLQTPFTPGGDIFRKDWWQRYNHKELPTLEQVVLSIDCAFKAGDENSMVAIQTWGIAGQRSYLLEVNTAHRSYTQTKEAIRDAVRQSGATVVLIEDKAAGPAVVEELRGEFPIIPINPGADSKVARAMACSPDVEAGLVYIPDGDRYNALIDELASFPKGRHDDNADALSMLLNWRRKRIHGLLSLWEKEMASPKPAANTHDSAPTPTEVVHRTLEQKRQATKALWGMIRR